MSELGVRARDLTRRGRLAGERAGFVRVAEAHGQSVVECALAEHAGERFVGAALRTHDKKVRGLRADEEPPEREAAGAGVGRERTERAQLPGVEGGEGRAHATEHDDKEARFPARREGFKQHRCGKVMGAAPRGGRGARRAR